MSVPTEIISEVNFSPYLVLWHNNGRIASVMLTEENRKYFTDLFLMSLIQKDTNGTEHWNVLSSRKKNA